MLELKSKDREYTVEAIYDDNRMYAIARPYVVLVNGLPLRNAQHVRRRFKTPLAATLAGTQEVERLREQGKQRRGKR